MSGSSTPDATATAAAPAAGARSVRRRGAGVLERAARRPAAAAALLYLVLSLLMFAPGFVPGRTLSASDYLWNATPWDAARPAGVEGLGANQELLDSVVQFQPAIQRTARALPDVPLWDPHVLSGRPFVADPQSSVFSIFSLPSYLLPFWASLAFAAAFKLWVAAFGAYLLGRVAGMRPGGALLTGLVFGFSLWCVTWVTWTLGSVWVFLPWVCLLAELCVRRPGPLPVAGLAAAVGLQFLGGHPASSFQTLAVVGLFFAGRIALTPRLRRRAAVRMVALGAGILAGGALAAAMLVPFAELLLHSDDVEARKAVSGLLVQPPEFRLGVFLHDYWGHGQHAQRFASVLAERAYYVGALPLMLAAAALVLRLRVERVAVALAGAVALGVATGLAPFYDVVVALPGFEASNNSRMAVVAVLALALLAGWGLDELTSAPPAGHRRTAVLVLAGALLLAPALLVARRVDLGVLGPALRVAWGFAEPSGDAAAVLRLASLLEWLALAAAAVALLVLRGRGRLGATAFVALALALVAGDLFKAGMGYNPSIDRSLAEQPATGAIRFLQDARPQRFAGLNPTARPSLTLPLSPNVSQRYGVYDARGYVLPTEERYAKVWRRAIAVPRCYYFICLETPEANPRSFRALGLFRVRYLLQNRRDAPLPGLRTAYAGPDARIYENPSSLPRAFLVDRQRVARDGDAALAAVTSGATDLRAVAVTEDRLPGLRATGATGARPGGVRVTTDEAERTVLRTDARRRALLVLTDPWYPGWRATLDGETVPVERVDYALRGVAVPAGRHRVELRYEPLSWRIGWILSLVTLAGLVAVGISGLRGRR